MTKRSFFKSLSSIVAAVALAPEIAFRATPDFQKYKGTLWIKWANGWHHETIIRSSVPIEPVLKAKLDRLKQIESSPIKYWMIQTEEA